MSTGMKRVLAASRCMTVQRHFAVQFRGGVPSCEQVDVPGVASLEQSHQGQGDASGANAGIEFDVGRTEVISAV